jgi:glycosyltransferase involved in cell wall biosynthesis
MTAARTPRLLFILNEALFFTTHRFPIGVAMRARGWEVHVAAPDEPGPRAKIEGAGFIFHPIPLERSGRSILGELKLVRRLWQILRAVQPDLVHHVAMKPVVWGGPLSRLMGLPSVHAITGLGYLFIREGLVAAAQRLLVKTLFRVALRHRRAVTIFQNMDDRGVFEAAGLVARDRIEMIAGCGADMTLFAASPEPAGTPVVMFPARLLGDKGVNEFVGAAEQLKAQGVEARFVLVGRRDPGNLTDIGQEQLERWIASGVVEYWGFREDMPQVLPQATIIVTPSYREGLPRGLIEAIACARAVVTTDVPGCRDVVRHEVNGLLVPVRDTAATAAAIKRLLDDPALRQRLAVTGRAIALAEFSVEHFVARSLETYARVLRATLRAGVV